MKPKWMMVLLTVMAVLAVGQGAAADSGWDVLENFSLPADHWQLGMDQTRSAALQWLDAAQGPARSGSGMLQIDYDFRGKPGTSGVYLFPPEPLPIPEEAEALGIWVFGDSSGCWLRAQLRDGAGAVYHLDLTTARDGINWSGWRFLQVDLPQTYAKPLLLTAALRCLALDGQPKAAGTIFVDEIIVIYDDLDFDTEPPLFSQHRPDATAVDAQPEISVVIRDGPDGSGLDLHSAAMAISGSTADWFWSAEAERLQLVWGQKHLAAGVHKVQAEISDRAGNTAAYSWSFEVISPIPSPQIRSSAPVRWPEPVQVEVGFFAGNLGGQAVVRVGYTPPLTLAEVSGAVGWQHSYAGQPSIDLILDDRRDTAVLSFLWDYGPEDELGLDILSSRWQDGDQLWLGGRATLPLVLENRLQLDVKPWLVPDTIEIMVRSPEGGPQPGAEVFLQAEGRTAASVSWGRTDSEGRLSKSGVEPGRYVLAAEADGHWSVPLTVSVPRPIGPEKPLGTIQTWTSDPRQRGVLTTWAAPSAEPFSLWLRAVPKPGAADGAWQQWEAQQIALFDDDAWLQLQRVELSSLQPDTLYEYYWSVDSGHTPLAPGTLQTAPAVAGTAAAAAVLFATDTHAVHGAPIWNDLLQQARLLYPDTVIILHGGDVVDNGFSLESWLAFLNDSQPHTSEAAFWPVIGNHDVYGRGRLWFEQLFGDGQTGPPGLEGSVQSAAWGPIRFFGFDSEQNTAGLKEQLRWLDEEIQQTAEPWRVAVVHRAPYRSNPLRGEETGSRLLAEALEAAGIDLVLAGHDHVYMRTRPLGEGTVYITGGAAGVKFYPGERHAYTDVLFAEDIPVFVAIEADFRTLTVETWAVDGRQIDRFQLDKGGSQ